MNDDASDCAKTSGFASVNPPETDLPPGAEAEVVLLSAASVPPVEVPRVEASPVDVPPTPVPPADVPTVDVPAARGRYPKAHLN